MAETPHMTFTGGPKDKEYERVIKELDKFFAKYPVDTAGRMATVKCVAWRCNGVSSCMRVQCPGRGDAS